MEKGRFFKTLLEIIFEIFKKRFWKIRKQENDSLQGNKYFYIVIATQEKHISFQHIKHNSRQV